MLHAYKDGRARFNGYLDDYSNLIDGLTRLYEVSGVTRWLHAALELAAVMIDEFHDREAGGFFYTGRTHETLIARQKGFPGQRRPLGQRHGCDELASSGCSHGPRGSARARPFDLEAVQVYLDGHRWPWDRVWSRSTTCSPCPRSSQ